MDTGNRQTEGLCKGAEGSPDTAAAGGGAKVPRRRLRKWLLRLTVAVLAPVVFLAVIECGFRLAGSGYDTRYFVPIPGKNACMGNEKFAWRFTPKKGAPEPYPFVMPVVKPPGTYRIFVLGESAALGVPDPSFGFSRILNVMLREQYPQARFEIINTAMMGINSHAIRPLARECAGFGPDLFVIYMGNNETGGYFGPTTVARGSNLLSLPLIRADLWVRSLRMGQWIRGAGGSPDAGETQDMKLFLEHQVAPDEPRCKAVADRFRANLTDILDAAKGAGARTILCTVAVNLKDCPPFGSLHRADLSTADKVRFDALYAQAVAAEQAGRHADAVQNYLSAEKIDDRYAELHFRLATGLVAAGRFDEAWRHFTLARDLDSIQFRTDSRLNEVIRETGKQRASQGVQLVDVERVFEREPAVAHGLVGDQLFYEHAHLNFEGNHALARAVFAAVKSTLPESISRAAATPEPELTRDRCAELLALTPLSEVRMAEPIASLNYKPPFLNQFDNAQRKLKGAQWLEQIRRKSAAADLDKMTRLFQAALARFPDDWCLHQNYADVLLAKGDVSGAAEQLREVLKDVPSHRWVEHLLGQVLIRQGKTDAAVAHYRQMVVRRPEFPPGYTGLGDALAAQGKHDEAIEQYRRVLKLNPGDAGSSQAIVRSLAAQGKVEAAEEEIRAALADQPALMRTTLAGFFQRQGRVDAALEQIGEAIKLAPSETGIRIEYATLLMSMGKRDQAVEALREVLRLEPRNLTGLNSMGAAMVAMGRVDEGIEYFRKSLAAEPNFAAYLNLGNLALMRRDFPSAEENYRKAIELDSRNSSVRHNLGSVLLARKKTEEAIEHLTVALQADPKHASAHHLLGEALKRQGKSAEAVKHFRASLELKNRDPMLLGSLAWLLATAKDDALRNASEAVKLAEEANEKTLFKAPVMLDTLGAAYAEFGQFERAARLATVAAEVASADGKSAQAGEMRARAALYRLNKPYRE